MMIVFQLNEEDRTCTVTGMSGSNNSIRLVIHFPENYPGHGMPYVEIADSTVNSMVVNRLQKVQMNYIYLEIYQLKNT